MKRLSTLLLFGCALFFAQEAIAQDGGPKKPKKKKNSEKVDTTSNKEVDKKSQEAPGGSGTQDIAIDEPGNTRGKGKTQNNNKTSGDTIPPKENTTPPKDEPAPAPPPAPEPEKPKEGSVNEAQAGAEAATEPQKSSEAAPEPPAGAGGLDASGSGTSLTIDEAGTKRANKPTDALNSKIDVNPTNLTIDEAGTQKAKTSLEGTNVVPGVDSLKQKAGGKVLDLIRPK